MGVTQILAPSERKFGWYMFLVGITYLVIYHQTSKHIDEFAGLFNDNTELENAFNEHAGVDKVLNREELARLFFSLDIDLSHAEMEMMMKRLDPDHDG
jgi:Ca2+-binding EF-hand superfamily protein